MTTGLKLSELVVQLQAVLGQHGDMPVAKGHAHSGESPADLVARRVVVTVRKQVSRRRTWVDSPELGPQWVKVE